MKSTLLSITLGFIFSFGFSQVGINTSTPSATLDIRAVNHLGSASPQDGLLVPRVSDLANGGIEDGQLLFLIADWTDDNGTPAITSDDVVLTKGFHYWDSNLISWADVGVPSIPNLPLYPAGDIKHGFQNADHQGWYLLDGRSTSTLPVTAQSAAITLGFAANLPNATNRVLKAKTGTETLGSQTGSNSITLAAANIPQVTGTTNTAGSHDHDYRDLYTNFGTSRVAAGNSQTILQASNYVASSSTSNSGGNHNHTVTVGNATPTEVNLAPASIVTNVFVYLGL
jgi:hypothetical protein